jgi:hypothetical protein
VSRRNFAVNVKDAEEGMSIRRWQDGRHTTTAWLTRTSGQQTSYSAIRLSFHLGADILVAMLACSPLRIMGMS